ncbi:MAG: hypothetical protein HOC27_08970 [Phycisphaerae bacterium]|jgi:hypothetical protein|nr:hypothetical protein [Phycisphaerae bacterium]
MKLITKCLFASATSLFILWCAGLLCSDKWGWSQWLAWIPTLAVVILFMVAAVFARFQKMKSYLIQSIAIGCILLFYWCFNEQRIFRSANCKGKITIAGWTMSHSKKNVSKESAEIIIGLDADITLLTHGWYVRGEPKVREWMDGHGRKVVSGPFTLFTKFQPIKVQSLIAADEIYISQFILDTTPAINDILVIWAIDLPSSITTSKTKVAQKVRDLLLNSQITPPDVVIGDFNMTRNSSAIQTMFPDLHDAADDGGVGIIGTFPMEIPIYHIDHVLLAPELHACSYECVNPHIGRHQIQVLSIK